MRNKSRKFAAKLGVIRSEFDVFEHMFDVIVNEVKKYSSNARKLEAKVDKQFERLNAIAIVQVKLKNHAVKHARRFNLQRRMHVKPRLNQRTSQAEHVKLCRALLRCNEKLPCFHRVPLCFTTNMSTRRSPKFGRRRRPRFERLDRLALV